jgi:hypothetical protein
LEILGTVGVVAIVIVEGAHPGDPAPGGDRLAPVA